MKRAFKLSDNRNSARSPWKEHHSAHVLRFVSISDLDADSSLKAGHIPAILAWNQLLLNAETIPENALLAPGTPYEISGSRVAPTKKKETSSVCVEASFLT